MAFGLQSLQDYRRSKEQPLPFGLQSIKDYIAPKINPQVQQFFENNGQHILPTIGAGISGAMGAADYQKKMEEERLLRQYFPEYFSSQNRSLPNPAQSNVAEPNNQQQNQMPLNDLLEYFTNQKLDKMNGLFSQFQPSQPEQLMDQAGQVANQQTSTQDTPQYNSNGPQFAFDQYLGQGGAQYNPFAALGDLGSGQISGQNPNNSWGRSALRGLGKGISIGSPYLAQYGGPWGVAGAGIGSALGYGLQQV